MATPSETTFGVNDAINRLARKYGTLEVQEVLRAWVEYIDKVRSLNGQSS